MTPNGADAAGGGPGSTKPAPSFEVVLVAYKSRPLIEKLFERLPEDIAIAVVDNGKGVDGLPEVVASRPGARYLEGAGEGFARAANLGASTSSADIVLFLNPDTAPTATQLRALVADLAADPDLAAVSATTVRLDGKVELGVGGWEPSARRALIYASGLHILFPTSGMVARPVPNRPMRLDWLTGACLAVPRARFLELGGFDESFFLYNEDMAYGRRVREAGYRQQLRTDILVPHVGGGSGEARTRMFQMRGASMTAYVSKHNGEATVLGVKAALSAGTLARSAVAAARGNRTLAKEHAAFVRGLWTGAPDLS